jgi:hypothetical protein
VLTGVARQPQGGLCFNIRWVDLKGFGETFARCPMVLSLHEEPTDREFFF